MTALHAVSVGDERDFLSEVQQNRQVIYFLIFLPEFSCRGKLRGKLFYTQLKLILCISEDRQLCPWPSGTAAAGGYLYPS